MHPQKNLFHQKKTSKLHEFLWIYLPILGSPVLALGLGWFIVHQYHLPMKEYKDGIVALACVMFMYGLFAGMMIKIGDPIARLRGTLKELTITFPPTATEEIREIRRYLEHRNETETVAKALAYYANAIEFVRSDGSKIVVQKTDKTTEPFDPVAFDQLIGDEGDDDSNTGESWKAQK